MIRLFLGLALPLSVREQLHALVIGISGARWMAPDSYHLTLRFIGNVSEDIAEDLHTALATIQAAPFALEVTGTGAFTQGNRVHSLWAGVQYTPHLFSLRDKVERTVVRTARIAPETRRYAPHITLARLKRNASLTRIQRFLSETHLFCADSYLVESFVLFKIYSSEYNIYYERIANYTLTNYNP